jgi:hypothetical protein
VWIPIKLPLQHGGRFRGLEIRPKDARVLRQAVIGWAKKGAPLDSGKTAFGSGVTPIGAWAFGYYTWRTPRHSGINVPEGAEMHVMLRCQPVGRAADGGFDLALYYEAFPVAADVGWLNLELKDFVIPPGQKPAFELECTLQQGALVTALLPEFRLACERVELTATLPNGATKLLFGGRWDVYWSGAYTFVDPPLLPAGTKLKLRAQYSNGFDSTHGISVRKPIESGPFPNQELCRMRVQILPT